MKIRTEEVVIALTSPFSFYFALKEFRSEDYYWGVYLSLFFLYGLLNLYQVLTKIRGRT